jgi:ribosomal-protein-alanine N-acetyltransferase
VDDRRRLLLLTKRRLGEAPSAGDFSIRPLRREDAEAVAAWHYEPPYDFYDFSWDHEDLAELMDPARWGTVYFAVERDGDLVGFFELKAHGDEVEVGLGLRPDVTGNGWGLSFVQAGLDFARATFSPASFWLDVATFNERAKKVYERAGFEPGHLWLHTTQKGKVEFLRMTRPA